SRLVQCLRLSCDRSAGDRNACRAGGTDDPRVDDRHGDCDDSANAPAWPYRFRLSLSRAGGPRICPGLYSGGQGWRPAAVGRNDSGERSLWRSALSSHGPSPSPFSAEVTGTIVMMVGLALIPLAVSRFLGIEESAGVIDALSVSIASITFFVMVGVTVWGSSRLQLFGVLIGIAVGSICAYASGLVTDEHLHRLEQASLLALPSFTGEGWS